MRKTMMMACRDDHGAGGALQSRLLGPRWRTAPDGQMQYGVDSGCTLRRRRSAHAVKSCVIGAGKRKWPAPTIGKFDHLGKPSAAGGTL